MNRFESILVLLFAHWAYVSDVSLQAQEPDQARRSELLAKIQLVMGDLPKPPAKSPLDVMITESTSTPKFERRKLTYCSEAGDRVPAYLLVPTAHRVGQRLPAMLCLHQTTKIGKGEPAGLGGKPNLRYSQELAEAGFVTLAPDYPSFGDYTYDFAKNPHASGSIKAVWNNIRAVDLLQSLPEVDAERIGCIGHSLGGHNSLFTAAFEPRIRAVVSCCGFTSFAKYYHGDLKGWTSPRYMPRIATVYGSRPEQMPFDFSDVLAAIAPRALFVVAPLHDDNFEVSGVQETARIIEPLFKQAGAKQVPVFRYPDCGHDFPPEIRSEVYAWLARVLGQQ
jgi:dipeptidyl aminopeptidase/acylaminoacyl peptidase